LKANVELDHSQIENIFRTRCQVLENTCSVIASSCNYCKSIFVDKLALTTTPYLKPYKFQWIKNDGEIAVKEQVNPLP